VSAVSVEPKNIPMQPMLFCSRMILYGNQLPIRVSIINFANEILVNSEENLNIARCVVYRGEKQAAIINTQTLPDI
jgi:hypothetical protein